MTKIHCLNPITKCGMGLFPAGYEMIDNAADADVVLVRSASMHDMELPENLPVVGWAGADVNNIPLDSCAQKGIVVFSTPRANANGVKELVTAGILVVSQGIVGGIGWCKASAEDDNITKDTEKSKKAFADCEIKGKELGVIGLRAIDAEVANVVTHLGMGIYGYDPYISINATWGLSRNVKHITNANIIFQKCDYITIHIPLMDSARGVISKERLAIMKDEVIILSFSRGTLVSDDDMAAAPDTGKVRYYVSDFPNPRVVNMEGVALLLRLGASTKESGGNCAMIAVKELADYLGNGNAKNSVSFPSYDMDIYQAESYMAVLRMNIPNMIGQITAILAKQDMNIPDVTNKSRNKYAYTLLDLEHRAEDSAIQKLRAIKSVLGVRVVKQPRSTTDGL